MPRPPVRPGGGLPLDGGGLVGFDLVGVGRRFGALLIGGGPRLGRAGLDPGQAVPPWSARRRSGVLLIGKAPLLELYAPGWKWALGWLPRLRPPAA